MSFFTAVDRFLPGDPVAGFFGRVFRQQPNDGGDYFDQNGQLIGNGGDASRPYSRQEPAAPAPVIAADPLERSSTRGQRVAALLADAGVGLQGGQSNQLAALDARDRAAASQAYIMESARKAGLTPLELLALRVDPTKFADQLGNSVTKNREPQKATAGETVRYGDGRTFTAPILRDHEGQYGTQTADGYRPTGAAPPSIDDVETERKDRADEKIKQADAIIKGRQTDISAGRAAETARSNRAKEDIDRQGLPYKANVGNTMAPIVRKIAQSGIESLTPGERRAYDDYMTSRQPQGIPLFGGVGGSSLGDEAPAKPAAPVGKPQPKGAPTGSPPASALKEGARTTFANGQVWTLKNGQPTRVQ